MIANLPNYSSSFSSSFPLFSIYEKTWAIAFDFSTISIDVYLLNCEIVKEIINVCLILEQGRSVQFMHDPLNRLCLLGRDREMIRPKARNMFDKEKIEINCIT